MLSALEERKAKTKMGCIYRVLCSYQGKTMIPGFKKMSREVARRKKETTNIPKKN